MTTRIFSSGIRRREDPRLITGTATYTDDIQLPGMAHAAILRSPHAHARIKSIDTSAAEAADGVVAVFTGADLEAAELVEARLVELRAREVEHRAADRAANVGERAGAGPGREVQTAAQGGAVGLILDGRGRPLQFPERQEDRLRQSAAWNQTLNLYGA